MEGVDDAPPPDAAAAPDRVVNVDVGNRIIRVAIEDTHDGFPPLMPRSIIPAHETPLTIVRDAACQTARGNEALSKVYVRRRRMVVARHRREAEERAARFRMRQRQRQRQVQQQQRRRPPPPPTPKARRPRRRRRDSPLEYTRQFNTPPRRSPSRSPVRYVERRRSPTPTHRPSRSPIMEHLVRHRVAPPSSFGRPQRPSPSPRPSSRRETAY